MTPSPRPLASNRADWRGWLSRHLHTLLFVAALALVLVLYVRQWTNNRSLWMDEAYLALNLRERTFTGLLQPLEFLQAAPVGYLWTVKSCQLLFGESEWSLRLPTLFAAVTALLLFALVLHRGVSRGAAAAALLFYGGTVILTRYATELKPYTFDVLAGNALMALVVFQSHTLRWRLIFALTTISALLFSYAALFLTPAAFMVCWARSLCERRYRSTLWISLLGAIWIALAATVYLTLLQSVANEKHFEEFWSLRYNAFLILPPWSPAGLNWWADFWVGLREGLFYYWTTAAYPLHAIAVFSIFLLPLGGYTLWRHRQAPLVSFWLLAFAFALTLSALGKYPLYGRSMLYLLPAYLVFLAGAFHALLRLPPSALRKTLLVPGCFLCLFPLGTILYTTAKPIEPRQVRTVYETLCRKFKPGDLVYLNYYDSFTYKYYQALLPLPSDPIIGKTDHDEGNEGRTVPHALKVIGHRRAWIIIAHISQDEGEDETRQLLDALSRQGRISTAKKANKATLYLYEPAP